MCLVRIYQGNVSKLSTIKHVSINLSTIWQNKQASAFAGKSFKHYNDMNPIMPSLAQGTHAYRPSNETQGSAHFLVNHTANLNNNSNDISDMELPPLSSLGHNMGHTMGKM